MKTLLLTITLSITLIMAAVSPTYAAGNQIKIDGVLVTSNEKPEIKNNRIMVPLRIISESLGVKVDWANSVVTLTKNNKHITLTTKSNTATIDGTNVKLDAKPYLKNNRVYVPLRFIAQTFDSSVDYSENTAIIHTAPKMINGVEVKAVQQEYHMTMGGVIQQINGHAYIEAIYAQFEDNKGEQVEAPSKYSWSFLLDEPGSYSKSAQYDFIDANNNSLKRIDIYYGVSAGEEYIYTDVKNVLIHDFHEDQWYELKGNASQMIWDIIEKANTNGFLTVVSNTVV